MTTRQWISWAHPIRYRAAESRRLPMLGMLVGILFAAPAAVAQRTDVVVLKNGDQITGEVKELRQGKLKYKTDHIDTIYVEWAEVASLQSINSFDVEIQSGARYFGSLAQGSAAETLIVVGPFNTTPLDIATVVMITPIHKSFWSGVDGSIDIGFSYTSADSYFQYSLASKADYRTRKFKYGVSLSSIRNQKAEAEATSRENLDLTVTRFYVRRFYGDLKLSFTHNTELGLELRTQLASTVGRAFVQSNRSLFTGSTGLAVSRETPIGGAPGHDIVDLVLGSKYTFFLYNFPKTTIDVELKVYPGLTEWGRYRFDFDSTFKREIVRDFTVGLTVYDSYDNRPLELSSAKNDFGVVASVGWTF